MPKYTRAQDLAQIGVFGCQDTFKAPKWAKNALKGPKLWFPSTLRAQMSSKSLINQLFLYESLFSYILAVFVWIFRPKLKKLDFEVISGYLEKRITVITVERHYWSCLSFLRRNHSFTSKNSLWRSIRLEVSCLHLETFGEPDVNNHRINMYIQIHYTIPITQAFPQTLRKYVLHIWN